MYRTYLPTTYMYVKRPIVIYENGPIWAEKERKGGVPICAYMSILSLLFFRTVESSRGFSACVGHSVLERMFSFPCLDAARRHDAILFFIYFLERNLTLGTFRGIAQKVGRPKDSVKCRSFVLGQTDIPYNVLLVRF